uniref:Uncharacterized protein n=1 Tax=Arundo donax TaxID=35708 RepID=A0A0A9BFI8_ARUDO
MRKKKDVYAFLQSQCSGFLLSISSIYSTTICQQYVLTHVLIDNGCILNRRFS